MDTNDDNNNNNDTTPDHHFSVFPKDAQIEGMYDSVSQQVFQQPKGVHQRSGFRTIGFECNPCDPVWHFSSKTGTSPAVIRGNVGSICIFGDTLAGLVFPNRSVIDTIYQIVLHCCVNHNSPTTTTEEKHYLRSEDITIKAPFLQPIIELTATNTKNVGDRSHTNGISNLFVLVPWACSFLPLNRFVRGLTIELYGPAREYMDRKETQDVVDSLFFHHSGTYNDAIDKNRTSPLRLLYGHLHTITRNKLVHDYHIWMPSSCIFEKPSTQQNRTNENITSPNITCWFNLNGGSDMVSTWVCQHYDGTIHIYRRPASLERICWQRMSFDQKCTYLRQNGPYVDIPSTMQEMPPALTALTNRRNNIRMTANDSSPCSVVVPCFVSYPRFIYINNKDMDTTEPKETTNNATQSTDNIRMLVDYLFRSPNSVSADDVGTAVDYLLCSEETWKKDSVSTESGVYVLHDGRFNILPMW